MSDEKFGTDLGLVQQAVVMGRRVGADHTFWSCLAHNDTLFAKVVKFAKQELEPSAEDRATILQWIATMETEFPIEEGSLITRTVLTAISTKHSEILVGKVCSNTFSARPSITLQREHSARVNACSFSPTPIRRSMLKSISSIAGFGSTTRFGDSSSPSTKSGGMIVGFLGRIWELRGFTPINLHRWSIWLQRNMIPYGKMTHAARRSTRFSPSAANNAMHKRRRLRLLL